MSPETRAFLATVRRAEDPSPDDESRVRAALQASIAANLSSPAPNGPATPNGAVAGGSSGLKVVGALFGLSVGAALVAAAVWSGQAEPKVESPLVRAPASGDPLRSSVAAVPSAASPVSAPAAAPAASSATSSAVAPPNAAHVARRATPSAVISSSASLREEIALLASVQAALERGDGTEALERLDRHRTRDRQLVAERRAARIAALCLLGRTPEAQALAAVFFRENADSVQRSAVERSCAVTKTSPPR